MNQSNKNVLCSISTKGRYDTTLPLAIMSVINQTLKPDKLVIFDDNDAPIDLRTIQHYSYLFWMLTEKGIEWEVIYGEKKGQHYNHQKANEMDFKYIWRLDDDTIAEPNVLEILMSYMKDDVGAVGGSILTPPFQKGIKATGKIEKIKSEPNLQWDYINEVKDVDHLHCSYLYRAGLVYYDLRLSKVAHREETLHSYGFKKLGYKVLVAPCITWHLKNSKGGIRSTDVNREMYEHDERIFDEQMNLYGVDMSCKVVVLDSGIGDHYAFKHILSDLKKKYKNIVLHVCYPEVFHDEPDIPLMSIQDAKNAYGNIDVFNIYRFMGVTNHKTSIVEAYKLMYQV